VTKRGARKTEGFESDKEGSEEDKEGVRGRRLKEDNCMRVKKRHRWCK
jgi:hypothetical protein